MSRADQHIVQTLLNLISVTQPDPVVMRGIACDSVLYGAVSSALSPAAGHKEFYLKSPHFMAIDLGINIIDLLFKTPYADRIALSDGSLMSEAKYNENMQEFRNFYAGNIRSSVWVHPAVRNAIENDRQFLNIVLGAADQKNLLDLLKFFPNLVLQKITVNPNGKYTLAENSRDLKVLSAIIDTLFGQPSVEIDQSSENDPAAFVKQIIVDKKKDYPIQLLDLLFDRSYDARINQTRDVNEADYKDIKVKFFARYAQPVSADKPKLDHATVWAHPAIRGYLAKKENELFLESLFDNAEVNVLKAISLHYPQLLFKRLTKEIEPASRLAVEEKIADTKLINDLITAIGLVAPADDSEKSKSISRNQIITYLNAAISEQQMASRESVVDFLGIMLEKPDQIALTDEQKHQLCTIILNFLTPAQVAAIAGKYPNFGSLLLKDRTLRNLLLKKSIGIGSQKITTDLAGLEAINSEREERGAKTLTINEYLELQIGQLNGLVELIEQSLISIPDNKDNKDNKKDEKTKFLATMIADDPELIKALFSAPLKDSSDERSKIRQAVFEKVFADTSLVDILLDDVKIRSFLKLSDLLGLSKRVMGKPALTKKIEDIFDGFVYDKAAETVCFDSEGVFLGSPAIFDKIFGFGKEDNLEALVSLSQPESLAKIINNNPRFERIIIQSRLPDNYDFLSKLFKLGVFSRLSEDEAKTLYAKFPSTWGRVLLGSASMAQDLKNNMTLFRLLLNDPKPDCDILNDLTMDAILRLFFTDRKVPGEVPEVIVKTLPAEFQEVFIKYPLILATLIRKNAHIFQNLADMVSKYKENRFIVDLINANLAVFYQIVQKLPQDKKNMPEIKDVTDLFNKGYEQIVELLNGEDNFDLAILQGMIVATIEIRHYLVKLKERALIRLIASQDKFNHPGEIFTVFDEMFGNNLLVKEQVVGLIGFAFKSTVNMAQSQIDLQKQVSKYLLGTGKLEKPEFYQLIAQENAKGALQFSSLQKDEIAKRLFIESPISLSGIIQAASVLNTSMVQVILSETGFDNILSEVFQQWFNNKSEGNDQRLVALFRYTGIRAKFPDIFVKNENNVNCLIRLGQGIRDIIKNAPEFKDSAILARILEDDKNEEVTKQQLRLRLPEEAATDPTVSPSASTASSTRDLLKDALEEVLKEKDKTSSASSTSRQSLPGASPMSTP